MSVITVVSELDVLEKYSSLVKQSLGPDSAYIRAKETLNEMLAEGQFTAREKSELLSQVLGTLSSSVMSTSMGTALAWASKEKDVALQKLELSKQLDILDQNILLSEAQVQKLRDDTIATQAQTIRMFGTPIVVDGKVTGLADTGKLFEEIALTKVGVVNAGKEGILLDAKKSESQAAIHKVIADTYRNHGSYTFSLADGGLTSVVKTSGSYTTLSDVQEVIAKEQANGYAYNAWANALSGSASLIGTALAGEYDPFTAGGGGTGDSLLSIVHDSANKLFAAGKAY